MKGWKSKTSEARRYEDLPEKCCEYIEYIEKFVDVPIKFIGVGESREALIIR